MRKHTFLILCLVLVVLLSGCISQDLPEESESSSQEKTEQEAASTKKNPFEDIQPETQEVLTEEKLEEWYPGRKIIVWAYNDLVKITSQVNLAINDKLQTAGKEYIILFLQIPEENFADEINRMIEQGNAPDIISAGVGRTGTLQGTYRAHVNGWFLCLDEYLQGKGVELWQSVPEAFWQCSQVNGHYYGISTALPTTSHVSYYVNAGLMEQFELTEETLAGCSVADLAPYLEMALQVDDCTPLVMREESNFSSNLDGFRLVVGLHQTDAMVVDCSNPDKGIVNLFTDENARKWFHMVSTYRQKGYLAEEGTANFFISLGYGNAFDTQYEEKNINKLKESYPNVEEIVVIPYGPRALTSNFNSITGVCAKSKLQENALEVLTVVMTDREISDLLIYGIEGQDYAVSDGVVQADTFSWVYSMYFGNTLVTTPNTTEPQNKGEVFTKTLSEMVALPTLGVYFDFSQYASRISEIQKIIEEYRGLLTGEYPDVDAALKEINQRLFEAGLDEIIQEANKQLKEKR